MLDSRNLFSGRRKYLWGVILLSFISVICAAFSMAGGDNFDIARREVLLRRIGDGYHVSFENELSFQPDYLVKSTRRFS